MENLMVISAEILITGLFVGLFCLLLVGLFGVLSATFSSKKFWAMKPTRETPNLAL